MSTDTAPWDAPRDQPRSLRLHPQSPSKALRRSNVDTCLFCGHHVWYFDRYDGGRIPLVPYEFPTGSVPPRARWSVDSGIARLGDMGRPSCWVAHPAVCPGIEHPDDDESEQALVDARRALAVRTRKAVEEGRFTATLPVTLEEAEDVSAVSAEVFRERHILFYAGAMLLGPDEIDQIQCVAAADDDQRCTNTVYDANSSYQGQWVEAEIPVVSKRRGQSTVWAGQTMWVYVLQGLDYAEQMRWNNQRCHEHGHGSTQPDAVARGWVVFCPFRDERHIRTHKPAAGQRIEETQALAPKRTRCAGPGCINGKVGTVPEHQVLPGIGWLCWKCRTQYERRQHTQKRWQQP